MADLLTSLDVVNQSFKKSLRGYDAGEVDEFLDQVAETLQVYAQKVKDLEHELLTTTERLNEYDKMKNALHKALLVAQKSADKKVRAAREKADRIVAEAMERADSLCHEAEQEVDLLRGDMSHIRDIRMQYEQEFRGMIAKFDTMLNQMRAGSALNSAVDEVIGSQEVEYVEEALPEGDRYADEAEPAAPQQPVGREDLENAFNALGVDPKQILGGQGEQY